MEKLLNISYCKQCQYFQPIHNINRDTPNEGICNYLLKAGLNSNIKRYEKIPLNCPYYLEQTLYDS